MTRKRLYAAARRVLGERGWAAAKAARNSFVRPATPRDPLLKLLPRRAVCAEIGVWKGGFSELILRRTRPKSLHLIDPWRFQPAYPDRFYGGSAARDQADMDAIFEDVRQRFAPARNVVIHRGTSRDVMPGFDDGYFDWVYIDANHSYEYVLGDLRLCLAKVRAGGIIAGDDWTWGEAEGWPVRRTVRDFVGEFGLEDRLTVVASQFVIGVP